MFSNIGIFLFYALTILLVVGGILPSIESSHWFIRAFDFPRIQFIVLTIVMLFIAFFIPSIGNYRFITIILFVIVIGLDLYRIGPYLPLYPTESKLSSGSKSNGSLSILSANVFIKNEEHQNLIDLVNEKKPDIVILLETDELWEKGTRSLTKDYPFVVPVIKDNGYGIILFSKYRLIKTEIRYLVDKNVPSIFTQLEMDDGKNVQLVVLHPRPPRPSEGPSVQRDGELALVAEIVREIKGFPVVVTGDLNDVAWSHTTRLFKRVTGLLDPRIGRGFYNTFPVSYPFFRFPLDHVFHNKKLALKEISRLRDINSDHFPIFVQFDLTSESFKPTSEPAIDSADKEDIDEAKAEAKTWDGPKEEVTKESE